MIIAAANKGEKIIKRRKRKSRTQMDFLAREFERDPEWTKERLLELSR